MMMRMTKTIAPPAAATDLPAASSPGLDGKFVADTTATQAAAVGVATLADEVATVAGRLDFLAGIGAIRGSHHDLTAHPPPW